MDFARKQLEKYGWTDGKGLGKNENGISEALKPKIKRSVTGIGHDPAAEFNEHWWTALYDKAAGNVEVEEKNGKTKKIKTKDDKGVVITTSTWKLKQKPKEVENEEQYSDFFVRTAVLTGAGNKVEKVRESESEDEESEGNKDVFKMTDEELFAACEGRTAHKGARHGLKATGKLARIAQQEAMLLHESRFSGYSHAKKLKNEAIEDMNLNSDSDSKEHKKKKKKRKRCNSNDKSIDSIQIDTKVAGTENSLPHNEMTLDENVASVINEEKICRKLKKSKRKEVVNMEIIEEESCSSSVTAKKKKRKDKDVEVEEMDVNSSDVEIKNSRKKKKKTKTDDL